MRHGGRHAAHGGQFFGAQARFGLAQILQKHHAQADAAIADGRRALRAHLQPAGHAVFVVQDDVRRIDRRVGKRQLRDVHQLQPGRVVAQAEHVWRHLLVRPQHDVRRRVGGAHQVVRIDHQHAIRQRFDHQVVDQRLHLRLDAVAARNAFLARQPRGHLVGEKGQQQQTGPGQPRLPHVCRAGDGGIAHGPRRVAEQHQRDQRCRAQRQRARAHDGRHQHRQRQQGRVVDRLRGRLQLQHGEKHQIDAHRRQPLRIERPPRQAGFTQQAHRRGQHHIGAAPGQQPAGGGAAQQVQA